MPLPSVEGLQPDQPILPPAFVRPLNEELCAKILHFNSVDSRQSQGHSSAEAFQTKKEFLRLGLVGGVWDKALTKFYWMCICGEHRRSPPEYPQ